jgi:ATPase components of various ABC-type transport systems, contain duplicated ATPase
MLMKMLEVRNICYREILNGVDFTWHQGEIIALMGANGSGKSTFARLLAGLIEPDQGEISLIADGSKCSWNKVKRWQEIGLVGQHPMRQTIGVTVAEELGFGLLNLGLDSQEVRRRVKELASSVDLGGKEDQSPATLSGGERQRLVTAAILALHPSFLILDEGLTMLDARAQANVLKLLFQARPKTGQLWITHDAELACHADRLVVLDQGKLVDKGSPRETFSYAPSKTAKVSEAEWHSKQKVKDIDTLLKNKTKSVLEWRQANYAGRLQVTKTINAGEFIGIVGPSGSGKTTLLEGAIGLTLPNEGHFFGFGEQISKESLSDWRRKTRLVLQEAGEYLIGRTAYHEIYYGDNRKALEDQRISRQAYLNKFGLTPALLESAPERLSGGERQRVALAAVLRTKPQILLLDEPLLGLDALSRSGIQTMISELENITILYVTHNLNDILQDADRLWLVEDGRIVLDCSKPRWHEHLEQFRAAGVRC